MVERSLFWDGIALGDCGPYSQSQLQDLFFRSVVNGDENRGPLYDWRDNLEVTGTASPLNVSAGGGCVYGMLFDADEAMTVDVPTPSSGASRYDRIIVQRDWSTQIARLGRHPGVAAATPAIPALTQAAGAIWEIPLATILVDDGGAITVTDAREFCAFPTTWPAGIVTGGMIAEGAVTLDKIPDRTRWDLAGSGQIKPDNANPCTWAAGPSWNYYTFAAGATNTGWAYFQAPTDMVGTTLNFYIWNGPTAVAAGNVKWDYNIYHGGGGGLLTNTAGTVAVIAQGGRAVGNCYRDSVIAITSSPGEIISFQLDRDGGAGTDTYGSPVWLVGIEMAWTSDH